MLDLHPCTPRVLAHREELMPRLVDVSSLDSDAQAAISAVLIRETSANRPPVCCAWLASEASIDDLAHHIARYLVGPGADGRPAFWRFYDPRVLALTLAAFDRVQRATLLGPVTDWQFAWVGHRWAVTGPGTPNDDSNGYMPAWPKPDQWSRISRSEAASRVIDRLPAMAPEKAARLPSELDRIFTAAAERGAMLDTDALADYAWHCVRYGQAFEQHPIVLDAWPALSQGEMLWSDVQAQFTPNDFNALETTSH
ncbi:DUF4123 domain-containing protein [Trinickia sp.]|uniref:DUF4123 domain-containing protein n=1 Tax=Trinickia sp. TaxID=2571163 RepID=UPI003F7E6A4F